MSSKVAEDKRRIAPASGRLLSITKRLIALNILAALEMFVSTSFFLLCVLERGLEREDNALLDQKIQVISNLLSKASLQSAALKEEIQWHSLAHSIIRFYTRILDEKGNLLDETPGMADLIGRKAFPPPSPGEPPSKAAKMKLTGGLNAYLITSVRAETVDKQPVTLQIALDVSDDMSRIADFARMVWILLVFGGSLATLVGIAITRRGLRPLRDITEVIQRVSPAHLDERLNGVRWPAELSVLADAFNKSLEGLEDTFDRLSQCATDFAHELRTPVNNLVGEAEVALSKPRAPEEYQRILESSLEEYWKLSRLIENILFMARAHNPKNKIEMSLLDASREIEAIREFYGILAEERGIAVICEGSAQLKADPVLFQRAVGNLLSNALRYTPQGGTVTISVREADDRHVEVSVKDTGIGIVQKDLPNIFDRFYRALSGRLWHPEGTGLGLPIVKSIMDLHDGMVHVQSELDRGTTVILRFPCV